MIHNELDSFEWMFEREDENVPIVIGHVYIYSTFFSFKTVLQFIFSTNKNRLKKNLQLKR